jgi:processive 1,2-diacylglycerol beta-glucosyltransferase
VSRLVTADDADAPHERRRPLVLILGLPLGGGHMTAARVIRRHLETGAPGAFEIRVQDLALHVRVGSRSASWISAQIYWITVAAFGGRGYARLYQYADRHPRKIARWAWRVFGRLTTAWLSEQDADLIIATHPLATHLAASALRGTATAVVGVVTDAGRVNRLWWEGEPDLLLVTHEDLVRQAEAARSGRLRVRNIGLIADPDLCTAEAAHEARRRIGLDAAFTVLMAGGGLGYGPNLERLAHRLRDAHLPAGTRFLVATGRNAALRASITEALALWSPVVCPREGMTDMMLAADLVIGKAGWLTVSECITAGKPVIVVDQVPGQEDENAALVEALGIGRRMSVAQAEDALLRYAADPSLLSRDFSIRRDLYDQRIGSYLSDVAREFTQRRWPAVAPSVEEDAEEAAPVLPSLPQGA